MTLSADDQNAGAGFCVQLDVGIHAKVAAPPTGIVLLGDVGRRSPAQPTALFPPAPRRFEVLGVHIALRNGEVHQNDHRNFKYSRRRGLIEGA